jgi:hypothetical protein
MLVKADFTIVGLKVEVEVGWKWGRKIKGGMRMEKLHLHCFRVERQ